MKILKNSITSIIVYFIMVVEWVAQKAYSFEQWLTWTQKDRYEYEYYYYEDNDIYNIYDEEDDNNETIVLECDTDEQVEGYFCDTDECEACEHNEMCNKVPAEP